MMSFRARPRVRAMTATTLSAVAMLAIALVAPVHAEEFSRSLTLEGDGLELVNMIGEVELQPASGAAYEIEIHVRGKDADPSLVTIEDGREGGEPRVFVRFPVEEHRSYVYPELGGGKTTFSPRRDTDSGWLSAIIDGFSGKNVTVSGRGRGLEVWADVVVKVPRGHSARTVNQVGRISAGRVEGDLVLDTSSGAIVVAGCRGDLVADTGSGRVEVTNHRGRKLVADTGSGSVVVEDFEGEELTADTGSGRVELAGIRCQQLEVDTGSGGVEAESVEADAARIDTGSGSITLKLDRMGDGRFVLDTGSGSVNLELPRDASAVVVAETGSGSVRVDLEGIDYDHRERDDVRFRIGGGRARVDIDTGSGSVRISQR
ncbi:MAG: DUF4097 family beta strand repeat-containing protein [Candidatus Krumholzibacteriia bacterium]